jgi:hypothetical protein
MGFWQFSLGENPGASAWSRNDVWVLIHYFQPLGGAFLRGAFQKL